MGNNSNGATNISDFIRDYNDENVLFRVADILLKVGIVCAILCACTLIYVDGSFNPTGLVVTIFVLFLTVIFWGMLNVLANISLSLKFLNQRIENQIKKEASK